MNALPDLLVIAKKRGIRRLSVAAADGHSVLKAVQAAKREGIVQPILIGDKNKITQISQEINFDISDIEIIDEANHHAIARISVALINEGKADILMKGLIGTAPMLRAVVHKETGLRKNTLLSHFTLFESKFYHKIFGATDVAMNIAPTLDEKIQIINNAVEIMHKLDVPRPKVAVLSPAETVNPKIESSIHASILTMMNKRRQITGCIVDGPLALDNAISASATGLKGIVSEVAGDADLLVVPDLNSGNILYKSLIFLGGASSAAVITGAKVPIVLTSRAASEESKLLSIALASVLE
jgi:phosphate butyryltransferase